MDFDVVLETDEDGVWVVTVPALPGCFTQGDTREEALANAREAIQLPLESASPILIHGVQVAKVHVDGKAVRSGLRPLPCRKVNKGLLSLGCGSAAATHVRTRRRQIRHGSQPPGKDVAAGTMRAILRYLEINFEKFHERT